MKLKKVRKRIKDHSALDCPSLDKYSRELWPCKNCKKHQKVRIYDSYLVVG